MYRTLLLLITLLIFSHVQAFDDPAEEFGRQLGQIGHEFSRYHEAKGEADEYIRQLRASIQQCGKCDKRRALIFELDKNYFFIDYQYSILHMGLDERYGRGVQFLFGNFDQFYPEGCGFYHSQWTRCINKIVYGGTDRSDPGFQLFPDLTKLPDAFSSCQVSHNRIRLCRYLNDKTYFVNGKPYLGIAEFDKAIEAARPRKSSLVSQKERPLVPGTSVPDDPERKFAHKFILRNIGERVNTNRKPLLMCEYKQERAENGFVIVDGKYDWEYLKPGESHFKTFFFWNQVYPLTADETNIIPQSDFWKELGRTGLKSCPEDIYKAKLQRSKNYSQMTPVPADTFNRSFAKLSSSWKDVVGNYRVEGYIEINGMKHPHTATATILKRNERIRDAEYLSVTYSDPKLNPQSPSATRYDNEIPLTYDDYRFTLYIQNDGSIKASLSDSATYKREETWTRDKSAPTLAIPDAKKLQEQYWARQRKQQQAQQTQQNKPKRQITKPANKTTRNTVPDFFVGKWSGTWSCGYKGKRQLDVTIDQTGMIFAFGVSNKNRKIPPGKIQYKAKGVRDWKYSHAVTYKTVSFKPVKWLEESKKHLYVNLDLNYNPAVKNKLTANVQHYACRNIELSRQ